MSRARAKFRDYDGRVRLVARVARSRAYVVTDVSRELPPALLGSLRTLREAIRLTTLLEAKAPESDPLPALRGRAQSAGEPSHPLCIHYGHSQPSQSSLSRTAAQV